MTVIAAPPTRVEAVDGARYFTREWRNFFLGLQNVGQASPQILGTPVRRPNQHAAIVTTPLTLPAISNGLYRLSVYQQVTTVDGVSSSLTTTLGWTNAGVPQTKSLAPMTGDTLTTEDSLTWTVHADNSSPFTYATAYASNTAGKMGYELNIAIESVAT